MPNYPMLLAALCYMVSGCRQPSGSVATTPPPTATVEADTSGAPGSITRTIVRDRDGAMWMATWEGMIQYHNGTFTNMTRPADLGRFFSALQDRTGHLWFGSLGAGVFRYDGSSLQNYRTTDGLVNDRVLHIYEDSHGHIWLGTEAGLSRFDGTTFQNFTTADGLPHPEVNAVVEDRKGHYWIGTRGGVCLYDGRSLTRISGTLNDNVPAIGLPFGKSANETGDKFHNVRHIIQDRNDRIWIGSQTGLWRYDGSTYTQVSTRFTSYIYEDSRGDIWTSSESTTQGAWELFRYSGESLHEDRYIPEKTMLFGIAEDAQGHIWAGTLNGVYRYDGVSFEAIK